MKKRHFRIIGLLVLSASLVTGAFGNTVSFDTTFNGTGYSIHPAVPPPQGSFGTSLAIQPDGKIVIGGNSFGNTQLDRFAVMRLNSDGTLDTSFGNGGSVTTLVGIDDGAGQVLIQSDGKILLSGISFSQATNSDFTILRYNTNGTLDTTFNLTGFTAPTVNGSSEDYGGAIALLPDGKIIMVGRTAASGFAQSDLAIMRFNTDGSLDSTFNGTGILTVGSPSTSEAAQSLIIQADGKLLIGGYLITGSKYDFMLTRLDSNGATDTTFGNGGMTITTASSGQNYISTMGRQSDGKIVAGGTGFIARYTANGILDTSFGTGGLVNLSPTAAEMNEIKIAGGDKILVACRFGGNAGAIRLMPNGGLDTNFNGGAANIHLQNDTCNAYSVAVSSDDKILLGGYCHPNGILNFAVFRLQETRTKRFLDFNGDGVTDISIFRPSNSQWWYLNSSNLATHSFAGQWGLSTDRLVPADFTGDGKTDVAVFRPSSGDWFVLRSENGSYYSFRFGTSGDIPIAADFDGDDVADHGVFRPSTNEWYIQKSTGGMMYTTFGTSGDKPVPSDYDGDFKTDIAIYRPSTGDWWINRSSDGSVYGFHFGTSSDSPVQGDYTGDNKTDAAVFRPSTGEWFILPSEGGSFFGMHFGMNGDLPTPGNYGGDSRFDFVVYRPSENRWYVQLADGNPYFARFFGTAGDQPLQNLFVP